ncbi:glycosyltransferase family 9 protein [Ferruginibacter sp.]|uniref:glycosyltransferase family 9 protein n=1 Tax=Ferruginibacter sp. TaxID=1940288 RepID=UPI00374D5562
MTTKANILLVQLYSNGDCLYATAVARQIKVDFPGCHLTWAIASFCKSIIAGNPFVDEIMEINSVAKNDVVAFRRLKIEITSWKTQGRFDEVFITHNADTNQAYYDGCIRSSILKAYPFPVKVNLQPVLHLSALEKQHAAAFVEKYQLKSYQQVILFEYAPLSGQSNMSKDDAIQIAEKIVANGNFAVILSSANKVHHPNQAIIDGSALSFRETAHLTNFCTFLLGSSSGITWVSTSDAGKQLPMIQLLNPYSNWLNSISRDFERFGIDTKNVIELIDYNNEVIVASVVSALANFSQAKKQYNQVIPLHFKTTRSIVYNLLCYLEFKAILTHIKVNREVYGNNISFFKEVLMGFLIFPFRLIFNIWRKNFVGTRKKM